jgi:hypothetical protein
MCPEGLRKATKDLSRGSPCPGRDSIRVAPENKSRPSCSLVGGSCLAARRVSTGSWKREPTVYEVNLGLTFSYMLQF